MVNFYKDTKINFSNYANISYASFFINFEFREYCLPIDQVKHIKQTTINKEFLKKHSKIYIKDIALKENLAYGIAGPLGVSYCILSSTVEIILPSSLGVKSLDGLQYAHELRGIDISDNPITDFTPLVNLKHLEYIQISKGSVINISSLEKLKDIKIIIVRVDKYGDLEKINILMSKIKGLGTVTLNDEFIKLYAN